MLRAFITFLTLLLLWALVAQINHYLAPLQIYLFVGGLFVTYAALRLPLGAGFAAVMAGGMLCDAAGAPVGAFGTQALLFALALAVIHSVRDRMARDETLIRVAIALVANLGLFLAFSFVRIAVAPMPSVTWVRLFLDLLCSQVVVVLIGPWFFALQHRALELTRSHTPAAN
jgi:rod shape-determining protein MreD